MDKVQVGELLGIAAGSNNHGCMDYAVARYLGNGKAEVIEAQTCHSCWQVGHDRGRPEFMGGIGAVIDTPEASLVSAGDNWSADVRWELVE